MADVGVIVGRFQIDKLHEGHIGLFEKAYEESKRFIVFIGIDPHKKDPIRNPLGYEAVKNTVRRALFKMTINSTILPILDCHNDDESWSENLDLQIKAITNDNETVSLYGGRDSFINSYSGIYNKRLYTKEHGVSATNRRNDIAKSSLWSNADFIRGVIWGTLNNQKR